MKQQKDSMIDLLY